MLKGVEHIGHVVHLKNFERYVQQFQQVLGLELDHIEDDTTQSNKIAYFKAGNVVLTLVAPLVEHSVYVEELKHKGEGLHHIAFEVDDIERAFDHYKEKGWRFWSERPVAGAARGAKIAMSDPPQDSIGGGVVELVELTPR